MTLLIIRHVLLDVHNVNHVGESSLKSLKGYVSFPLVLFWQSKVTFAVRVHQYAPRYWEVTFSALPVKVWQTCDSQACMHQSPNTLKRCDWSILKSAVLFSSPSTHWGFILKVLSQYSNHEGELVIPLRSIQKAFDLFEQETTEQNHDLWKTVVWPRWC